MRIQVRKCPFTGGIFEEKYIAEYITHLKELRSKMKEDRRMIRIRANFADWLKKEKSNIVAVDMIAPWILANQRTIMDRFNECHYASWKDDKFYPADKFTKIILSVKWDQNTSNSHVYPEGGVTNWGNRDKSKPSGYPGWHGTVTGTLIRSMKHNGSYPCSDFLKMIGIYTGSGTGVNERFNLEVTLFLSDWPGLSADVLVKKLQGIM